MSFLVTIYFMNLFSVHISKIVVEFMFVISDSSLPYVPRMTNSRKKVTSKL